MEFPEAVRDEFLRHIRVSGVGREITPKTISAWSALDLQGPTSHVVADRPRTPIGQPSENRRRGRPGRVAVDTVPLTMNLRERPSA